MELTYPPHPPDSVHFSPQDAGGIQIGERPIDEVMSQVVFADQPVIVPFVIDGTTYDVNMASIRYKMMAHSRTCACCGIIANRAFLEPYPAEDGSGRYFYRWAFYADTRYKPRAPSHLVLLTIDHTIPKSEGGGDDPDNLQVFCYLCNVAKTNLKMSAAQIRDALGLLNRIHRSSFAVRKTRESYESNGNALAKARKDVANMSKGLDKIKPENRAMLQARVDEKVAEAEALQIEYDKHLLQAQTSGVIPGYTYEDI